MAKESSVLERSLTAAGPFRTRTGFPVCRATIACVLGHQCHTGRYASDSEMKCQRAANDLTLGRDLDGYAIPFFGALVNETSCVLLFVRWGMLGKIV
jgi:hypothetical protein